MSCLDEETVADESLHVCCGASVPGTGRKAGTRLHERCNKHVSSVDQHCAAKVRSVLPTLRVKVAVLAAVLLL